MKTPEKDERMPYTQKKSEYILSDGDSKMLVKHTTLDVERNCVPFSSPVPSFICAECGKADVTSENAKLILSEGDVLYLPPESEVTLRSEKGCCGLSFTEFSPAFLKKDQSGGVKTPTDVCILSSEISGEGLPPSRAVYYIENELKSGNHSYSELIRSYIDILLLYILRKYGEAKIETSVSKVTATTPWLTVCDNGTPSRMSAHSSVIKDLTEEIKSSITGEISIDKLASDAHMSRSNFFRVFKRHVGMSVNEYIVKTRVEKVIDILSGTESNILDAAYASGFTSASGFYKAFKKITGMTPREYLKTAK